MRVLITGGAGFVGSRLALGLQEQGHEVVTFDNLRRRGSELNLPGFAGRGIAFVHGDIRQPDDLVEIPGNFDLMIEASAEPSVHAGREGSPAYVLATNLGGTVNCLEFARRRAGAFIFLSTSRVYSIAPLRQIGLRGESRRFAIGPGQTLPGVSERGIAEDFPRDTARSFYGTTKLASELLIQEYVESYRLKAIVNRCGIIAGPGQFGKVDQGIVSLWVARHHFGLPLQYTGFGGTGKQVRDLLHPSDLLELLQKELSCGAAWNGEAFNVGGGPEISVSLVELTDLCRTATGNTVPVTGAEQTSAVDVPLYISDCRKAADRFGWQPRIGAPEIVSEIGAWLEADEARLRPLFT